MGIGSFAVACLLAVGAGAPPDEWPMNQTQFKIPIHVKPEMQADIAELRLFCSRDEGRTWHHAGTAKASQDGFLFNTNGDGKYWFKVAVVNGKGVQDPADIYTGPVGQKILLKTTKPEVRVDAQRQGEQVAAVWEITELYPRPDTLKVEYRTADAAEGIWNSVAVTAGNSRVSFKPDGTGAVTVRVQIEDVAGNVGTGQATIASGAVAAPLVQTAMPPPPAPPPSGVSNSSASSGNSGSNWNTSPPGTPQPPTRPGEVALGSSLPTAPSQTLSGGPVAMPPAMRGALPALQIVNKSQVRLEYAVAKLGPSGVGTVEVYVTTDEGQSWERCPAEIAPGLAATDPRAAGTVTGGVLVPLPRDEVVYGFYMVVKSRAGLGKPPPKSGDLPQIRIERDTVAPAAHWLRPMPDPARRDTLILAWEASDRNLAQNPVTLEWADDPGGPWHAIGKPDMPNTGRFAWQVPADIKPSVYLRLSVRDTAGNIGVHQTEQPELVDLSVPEATITGVGVMK
jgi:hypothetical protein